MKGNASLLFLSSFVRIDRIRNEAARSRNVFSLVSCAREFRRRIDLRCFLSEKDLRTVFHARTQEIFLSRYGLDKAILYNFDRNVGFRGKRKKRKNAITNAFQLGPTWPRAWILLL